MCVYETAEPPWAVTVTGVSGIRLPVSEDLSN